MRGKSEAAAVGDVAHKRKRLYDERSKRHCQTPPGRLVDTRRPRRDKLVALSSSPDRPVGRAAHNLFARLLAHRNCRIGKPADTAGMVPIPMSDQHLPNRSAELQRPATYPSHFVCRDRRVHHK
jgi:hypothetical protein